MNGTSTYTLTIPSAQGRLFKSLAKEMGWIVEKPKAMKNVVEYEPNATTRQAIMEAKTAKRNPREVYDNVETMMKDLLEA